MAQTSNRILDEIARMVTDATGAAQGIRREAETVVRAQFERLVKDMDVASREEVEVLRDLLAAARDEHRVLAARVDGLEARLAAIEVGPATGAVP